MADSEQEFEVEAITGDRTRADGKQELRVVGLFLVRANRHTRYDCIINRTLIITGNDVISPNTGKVYGVAHQDACAPQNTLLALRINGED